MRKNGSDATMRLFMENKQNVSEGSIMEYTFNRKHTMTGGSEGQNFTREWNRITTKMRRTLDRIVDSKYTEAELASWFKKAIRDGEPLPKNPEMIFWMFGEPESMPADARCEYVYLPTYLMVLSMVAAVNRYPGLMDISGIRDTLSRGLKACTGRGLSGSGFEGMNILLENIRMFTGAGIKQFMAEYPVMSPEFREMFEDIITDIRSAYNEGRHIFDYNGNFKEKQRAALDMYDAK